MNAQQQMAFLTAMRSHGNVVMACKEAGVDPKEVVELRRTNTAFKSAWEQAFNECVARSDNLVPEE